MKAINEIVKQLREQAAADIRALLEKDLTYAEISLKIFDAYRAEAETTTVQNELSLDEKSFKIFERIIYLTILRYFGLEDHSMKDVLATTVFYALNGNSKKEKSERIEELEDYFHAMKRYEIEEEASSLLSELYLLSQGSQLETVYRHLYLKYKELDSLISAALQILVGMHNKVENYLHNANPTLVRDMIQDFKLLRTLSENHPESKNLNCLANLAKIELVVLVGQDQLLKDGKVDIETLLFNCKNQIDSLAFGLKRFHLQNILSQVQCYHLIKHDCLEEALELSNELSNKAMFEAYNYQFPEVVYKDIRNAVVAYKFHARQDKLRPSKSIQNTLDNAQHVFKQVVHTDLFGRNPYSHLVN
ncbi:MAG: hypothetical protein CMP59_06635 [Flavobacteriales bacterium]|nr:hypothetical protein [Flavobacteriales bacterium]|tara:strand:- start:414 stop:1496 length:1083 start_codon:yes stop_codon:yes gene_type:complete